MGAKADVWRHRQEHSIFGVAISGNGEYISTGSKDGTINCFDRQGKLLWSYSTKGQIGAVSLSSDGRYIVAGSADKNAYCFRWMDKLLGKYGIGEPVLGVAISGDGKYIMIGSAQGGLFWIERESGKLLWRYRLTAPVFGVAISENGKFATACSVNSVLCFTSGKLDWKFDTGGHVLGIAISGNGKYICVTSEDNHLYFLDRGTGQVMWKYKAEAPMWGIAVSSSGEYVVHGSDDGFVHCFNGITGKTLWKYNAKTRIYGVSISAKGTYIVASSVDENIFCFENYLVTSKFALKHTHDLLEDAEALGIEVGEVKAIIKDAEAAFASKDYARVFKQCKNADEALVALIEMKKTEIPVAKPIIEVLETEESKKMRNWVITLGVIDRSVKFDPEITNALVPLYNKHEQLLHDTTIEDRVKDYESKISMFENILKNYERISKLNPASAQGIMKVGEEVKAGISALRVTVDQLRELQNEKEKTVVELEDQVRLLVVDWLTGVSRLATTGELLKATEKREREITQMVEEIINDTMTKFKAQPGIKPPETASVPNATENAGAQTVTPVDQKSRISSWIEPSLPKQAQKSPENLENAEIDEPAPTGDGEPALIEPSNLKPVTEYKPAKLPEKIDEGVEEIINEMKSDIDSPKIEVAEKVEVPSEQVNAKEEDVRITQAEDKNEAQKQHEETPKPAEPITSEEAEPIFVIADEEPEKGNFELLDESGNAIDKQALEQLRKKDDKPSEEAVFEEIIEDDNAKKNANKEPSIKEEGQKVSVVEKTEEKTDEKLEEKTEKKKGRRGRKGKKGKEQEKHAEALPERPIEESHVELPATSDEKKPETVIEKGVSQVTVEKQEEPSTDGKPTGAVVENAVEKTTEAPSMDKPKTSTIEPRIRIKEKKSKQTGPDLEFD